MRITRFFIAIALSTAALATTSCNSKDDVQPTDPNTGAVYSIVGDQVGRPGVNTVFISAADKNDFNATTPSTMGTAYQAKIQSKLLALNPNYSKNFLGLDAATFSGVLATDVLNVATSGATTYYDGTNALTGRNLGDDVIDFSVKLIFGGPTGSANPTLTSDHVDKNDKAFLSKFPYEAAPW